MRQPHNLVNIVDCAHGVGSPPDGHHAGVAANLRREVEHVKGAIARLDVGRAHLHPALLQAYPGRDIRVMIQAAHQQLVPALQLSAQGATQGKGQRRHVGAEDHLVGCAIEEVRHRGARIGNHPIGALAGEECTPGVRVACGEVIGNRVNHALRHLGTARSIEERGRLAVHRPMQRRKLLTHPGQI